MVAEHLWTFLTNHAHVLLTVAGDPDIRVQHIADAVGISPRAALLILQDLEEAGYVRRDRVGRRNHYTLDTGRPFRHPATATHDVAELIAIFSADAAQHRSDDDGARDTTGQSEADEARAAQGW